MDTETASVEALAAELCSYNAWRRSETDDEMPEPHLIGCMIDEAAAMIRSLAAERDTLRAALDAAQAAAQAPREVPTRKCSRPQCGGDMLPGVALGQTWSGVPDFPGHEAVTMSPGGPGRVVACLKCNVCGHSVTQP